MTDNLFDDYVAIDTNVFLHLLNSDVNTGSHINILLEYLLRQGATLVVDDRGRIASEYDHHIAPILFGNSGSGNQIYLLRYWIRLALRREVSLNMGDRLMAEIRSVLHEDSESVDRIFVYVAFKNGSVLISNDETHIVVGPPRESGQRPRRDRLLRSTRRLRPDGAAILTSQEAYAEIT